MECLHHVSLRPLTPHAQNAKSLFKSPFLGQPSFLSSSVALFPARPQPRRAKWRPASRGACRMEATPSALSRIEQPGASRSKTARKKVVVIGGSGRVGGSTALALVTAAKTKQGEPIDVVVAGRSQERAGRVLRELSAAGGGSFTKCDTQDPASLRKAIEGADLVVHTAGPFQQAPSCQVLEAAIDVKVPYIDVCDDVDYSQRAKRLHERAKAAGVPAITTAGIYPGVSNIMAAELIRELRRGGGKDEGVGVEPTRLRFSYYTAGSGGAGPTILATSFLLLGEDTIAFKDGKKLLLKSYTQDQAIDFGKYRGKKRVYLLNLPEVSSCHETLGVPTVSARFGTDPMIWNWAMQAVGALAPRSFLEDRGKVEFLAKLSDPWVRLVDKVVGERMSMRVDVDGEDGKKSVGLYSHKKLSECVGTSVASFAQALLEGSTQPGVWFPEEEGAVAVEDRALLLERAAKGCSTFVMHKSPWMIETPPKEIGFGLYLE